MGLFRRGGVSGIPARAYVVPRQTGNVRGNQNDFLVDARVKSQTMLVVLDGRRGGRDPEVVVCELPNWLRIVMDYAGSGIGPHDELRKELFVPLLLHPETGKLVALDVAGAEQELRPFREVGRAWFLQTQAPLGGVRSVVHLPGEAAKEVSGLLGAWRSALRGLRSDLTAEQAAEGRVAPSKPAMTEEDAQQAVRTAVAVRGYLAKHPKEREKQRATVVQAGPAMADGVRAGVRHPRDFEHWLAYQAGAGLLSPDEVDGLRARAAGPPPTPAVEAAPPDGSRPDEPVS